MKNASLLLCFLACCGSASSQEKNKPASKPAETKPEEPARPAKPKPVQPVRKAAPIIRWGAVQFLQQEKEVVVRRLVARPGQAVFLGGNNPVVLDGFNPNAGSLTFKKFVSNQIGRLTKVCELSPEQKRKLEVAGKGVVHRENVRKSKEDEDKPEPAPNVNLGGFRIVRLAAVPRSADFQKTLSASKLWTRTLSKVLTEKQKAAWKNQPVEKPGPLKFGVIPQQNRGLRRLNQAIEGLNINVGR